MRWPLDRVCFSCPRVCCHGYGPTNVCGDVYRDWCSFFKSILMDTRRWNFFFVIKQQQSMNQKNDLAPEFMQVHSDVFGCFPAKGLLSFTWSRVSAITPLKRIISDVSPPRLCWSFQKNWCFVVDVMSILYKAGILLLFPAADTVSVCLKGKEMSGITGGCFLAQVLVDCKVGEKWVCGESGRWLWSFRD